MATDDLGDEGTIGSEVVEVARAAQQQGLFDGALEVAVALSTLTLSWALPRLLRVGRMP